MCGNSRFFITNPESRIKSTGIKTNPTEGQKQSTGTPPKNGANRISHRRKTVLHPRNGLGTEHTTAATHPGRNEPKEDIPPPRKETNKDQWAKIPAFPKRQETIRRYIPTRTLYKTPAARQTTIQRKKHRKTAPTTQKEARPQRPPSNLFPKVPSDIA